MPTTNIDEMGVRGEYAIGAFTGIVPASLGSGSNIAHLRWSDSTGFIMGIRRLRVGVVVDGAIFTTFPALRLQVFKAVFATANGNATGGAGLAAFDPVSGCKRRPTIGVQADAVPDSLVGATDFSIMGTASMTFTNAPTVEPQPIAAIVGTAANATNGLVMPMVDVLLPPPREKYAMYLKQDDALLLRNGQALGTGGTWCLAVNLEWDEITGV